MAGATELGRALAATDGSFDITVMLVEGENRLVAVAVDRALNQGPASSVRTVVLDTVAPDVPVLDDVPGYVSDPELRVTGTAEPLASVSVMLDGVEAATAAVSLLGTWMADITVPAAGANLTVRAVDQVGNAGGATLLRHISLDTTPPVAAAGADVTVVVGRTVDLDGSASTDDHGVALHTWTFTEGGSPVTLDGPEPSHAFSVVGTYTVTLTVTDVAGNTATDALVVTVVPENAAPLLTAGAMAPDRGTTRTSFAFTVRFTDADGDSGTVWVVIDGDRFVMTPDPADTDTTDGVLMTYRSRLAAGPHSYYFEAKDSGGLDATGASAGQANERATGDIDRAQSETPGPGAALAVVAVMLAAAVAALAVTRRRRQ
jgi:hypothetical protein